jgi:Protein of unknown function DUF262
MKASDIKKLTDWGNYSVDTLLIYLDRTIREWQEELGLELCPNFQRGHVWTQEQQVKFVEYILRGGKTSPLLFNDKNGFNGAPKDFVCVDGLQRLTALLSFLNDELPAFGHKRAQIEGIDRRLRELALTVRVNGLKTDVEVLEWYLELNSGGTPHTEAELDRVRNLLVATQ